MITTPQSVKRHRINQAAVLVKQECANHSNGHCIEDGTRIGDKRPRCLVMQNLPCTYFERCLTPLCIRHAEWDGALDDYETRTNGWEARVPAYTHPHLPRIAQEGPSAAADSDQG